MANVDDEGSRPELPTLNSLNNILKSGFLKKEGGSFKSWKKRFCVVDGALLYYFHEEKGSARAIDAIDLTNRDVDVATDRPKEKLCFRVSHKDPNERTYYFVADSLPDLNEWIAALKRIVAALNSDRSRPVAGSTSAGKQGTIMLGRGGGVMDIFVQGATPDGNAPSGDAVSYTHFKASKALAPQVEEIIKATNTNMVAADATLFAVEAKLSLEEEGLVDLWTELSKNHLRMTLRPVIKPKTRAERFIADLQGNDADKLKNSVFRLKSALEDSALAEEFIAQRGISSLLAAVGSASGNTQSYALSAMRAAMSYVSGMQEVYENSELLRQLFAVLSAGNVNLSRSSLELLFILCNYGEDGFERIHAASLAAAEAQGQRPYASVIECLKPGGDVDAIGNALTLIVSLVSTCGDAGLVRELIASWDQLGLHELMRQAASIEQSAFIGKQLEAYEDLTGVPISPTVVRLERRVKELSERLKTFEDREPLVRSVHRDLAIARTVITTAVEAKDEASRVAALASLEERRKTIPQVETADKTIVDLADCKTEDEKALLALVSESVLKVEILEEAIKTTKHEVVSLAMQNDEYFKICNELVGQVDKLQGFANTNAEMIKQMTDELQTAKTESSATSDKLTSLMEIHRKSLMDHRESHTTLTNQVATLTNENATLRAEIDLAQRDADALFLKGERDAMWAAQLQATLEAQAERANKAEAKCTTLETVGEGLRTEVATLQASLAAAREAEATSAASLSQAQGALSSAEATAATLRADVVALTTARDLLQRDTGIKETTIKSLQEKESNFVQQVAKLNTQVLLLQDEEREAARQRDAAQSQLRAAHADAEALREQMAATTAAFATARTQNNEAIASLEAKIQSQNAEIAAAGSRSAAYDEVEAQLKAKEAQLAQAATQAEADRVEKASLKEEVASTHRTAASKQAELDAEIASLTTRLAASQDAASAQAGATAQKVAALESVVAAAEHALAREKEDSNARIAAKDSNIAELTRVNTETKAKVTALESELASAGTASQSVLEAAKAEATAAKHATQAANAARDQAVAAAASEKARLEEELRKSQAAHEKAASDHVTALSAAQQARDADARTGAAERTTLAARATELEEEIKRINAAHALKVAALEAAAESLRSALPAAEQTEGALRKAQEDLRDAQLKVSITEADLASLRTTHATLTTTHTALVAEHAQAQAQAATVPGLQAKLTETTARADEHAAEAVRLKAALGAAETASAGASVTVADLRAGLEAEKAANNAAQAQVAALTKTNADLQAAQKAKSAEAEALSTELTSVRALAAEAEALRREAASSSTAQADAARISGELATLKGTLATVQAQLASKDGNLEALRTELAQVKAADAQKTTALEQLRAQSSATTETLAARQAELDKVTAELTALKETSAHTEGRRRDAAESNAGSLNARLAALEVEAETARAKAREASSANAEQLAKIAELQAQLTSKTRAADEAAALSTELATLRSDLSARQALLATRDAELAKAQADLSAAEAARATAESNASGASEQLAVLTTQLASIRAAEETRSRSTEEQRSTAVQGLQAAEARAREAEAGLAAANQRAVVLAAEGAEKDVTVARLTKELADKTAEHTTARESEATEMRTLRAELLNAKAAKEGVDRELQSLKTGSQATASQQEAIEEVKTNLATSMLEAENLRKEKMAQATELTNLNKTLEGLKAELAAAKATGGSAPAAAPTPVAGGEGSAPPPAPVAPVEGGAPPPPPPMMPGGPPPPPPPGGGPPPPPGGPGGPPPPPGGAGPARPTKPTITPGTKMKPLFWQRVLVQAKTAPNRAATLWDGVEESPLDTTLLERLFGTAAKAEAAGAAPEAAATTAAAAPKKPKFASVLDGKRSNAISFLMAKLPPAGPALTAAIENLDDTAIGRDALSSLMANAPTEDEVAAIREAQGGELPLDKPEQFALAVSEVPKLKEVLKCWIFSRNFVESRDEQAARLNKMTSAIAAVRTSTALKVVLGTLLSMGNYMNGGTNRGQADGFDLSVLSKLADTKDSEGSGTLLTHLVTFARARDPATPGALATELASAESASTTALADLEKDINVLANDVKNTKAMMEAALPTASATFKRQIPAFFADAESEIAALQTGVQEANKNFTALLLFTGVPAAKASGITTTQFFEPLWGFVREFNTQWNKAEAKPRGAKVGGKVGPGGGEGDPLAALADAIKNRKPEQRKVGLGGPNLAAELAAGGFKPGGAGAPMPSAIEARLAEAKARMSENRKPSAEGAAPGAPPAEETPLQAKLRLARERNAALQQGIKRDEA